MHRLHVEVNARAASMGVSPHRTVATLQQSQCCLAGCRITRWLCVGSGNASVAAAAFVLVRRVGRPGGRVGSAGLLLAAPIAIVAVMGAVQLRLAPEAERMGLAGPQRDRMPLAHRGPGRARLCGLLWAFRRLAPTRFPLAGFSAGVLAGSAAASVYALACTESGAAFLATWYTLGILGCGVVGALAGSRLLRW